MLQLYTHVLVYFARDLTRYEMGAFNLKQHDTVPITAQDKGLLAPILESCDRVTEFFWMPATAARKERLVQALEAGCAYPELGTQLRMLREAMEDELKHLLVLYMPPGQAGHFYAGDQLLGEAVIGRFPGLGSDIDEAGKCLGSGRSTAAVFHLMRVMEIGVQEFGTKLGVPLVGETNWQNILDLIDKAIKAVPKSDPQRPKLAEASASLFAVKLAWRNEVMHPKAIYTGEEGENVLGATKAFMCNLAQLV